MPDAASRIEHLAVLGRVELDGLDAPVGVALPQDGGFGLHGASQGECGVLLRPSDAA